MRRSPLLFLKIEKSVLIFDRKAMIVSILGLIFYSKCAFKRPLFLLFLRKSFSKCPSSTNQKPPPPPLPWKILGCASALRVFFFFFYKTLHLKCLIAFWIRLYLDNCTVICTASDTFRILAYLALCFSGICRYIQSYSALLRRLKIAYWTLSRHI